MSVFFFVSFSNCIYSAAKTALLLDNTQLNSSAVHVEAAHNLDDIVGGGEKDVGAAEGGLSKDGEPVLEQEDKPRSRIVAEYLAHGYVISDHAIQRAIALDKKHGISTRFTTALHNFDKKYGATDRAKGLDQSYKISDRAATGWRGLHSYFEKALETPSGQKLCDFYVKTDKQVRDIHNEARRLADLKSGKTAAAADAPHEKPEAAGAEGASIAPSVAAHGEPAGTAPPAEPKA